MKHPPAVWIALFMLTGTTALAQTTQPDTSVKEGAAAEETWSKDLLAGPKVDQAAAGDTDSRFGGPGRAQNQVAVPTRQWFALLGTLDLSENQGTQIREIVESFQQTAQKHQQTNGPRIRHLQREVRQARRENRDVLPETRRELGELRAEAPRPAKAQQRIWELLREPQQQRMRVALAQLRSRIAAKRAARRTDAAMVQQDAPPQRLPDRVNDGLDDMARQRLRFLRARQSQPAQSDESDR